MSAWGNLQVRQAKHVTLQEHTSVVLFDRLYLADFYWLTHEYRRVNCRSCLNARNHITAVCVSDGSLCGWVQGKVNSKLYAGPNVLALNLSPEKFQALSSNQQPEHH